MKNSSHCQDTCSLCVDERKNSVTELCNRNSPKTDCHIEQLIIGLKGYLGNLFKFHKEGKTCNCSLPIFCELPFPLGEVSGKYTGMGLDGMVAHAIKISNAMLIKDSDDNRESLKVLILFLLMTRTQIWKNMLVYGVEKSIEHDSITTEFLYDYVQTLKVNYGPRNAWWNALMNTVDDIVFMNGALKGDSFDLSRIANPMFRNFKQIEGYNQSQLRNQEFVCENKLWAKFMMWPTLADGSLVINLPSGTRCNSCNSPLTGEVIVKPDGLISSSHGKSHPLLVKISSSSMGENGQVLACCSIITNPRCFMECCRQDPRSNGEIDEDIRKQYLDERKLFISNGRDCDLCLKTSLSSHRCSNCHAAQYCSTNCQLTDFKFHKTVCSSWANVKSRKIISAKEQKKRKNLEV